VRIPALAVIILASRSHRLPTCSAHASLALVDVAFFAEWTRRAFELACYSAGIGGALALATVMIVWCALRPGTSTVIGTGVVALGVLGAGAAGARSDGHALAAALLLGGGAVFVALSLRGAKRLEPAFLVARRVARAAASMPATTRTRVASGGPYRSQDGLADDARRSLRVAHAAAMPATSALWSRTLMTLYASAVLAVLVGAGLAS
jgi:hypothetical protein